MLNTQAHLIMPTFQETHISRREYIDKIEQIGGGLRSQLIGFARKYLGYNAENDEDVVQETLMSVWLRPDEFDLPERHKNYIYTALNNKIIDHFRKSNVDVVDFSSYSTPGDKGETKNVDLSPSDDKRRSGVHATFSSIMEMEDAQDDYEKRLREELDKIKPVLEPQGKIDYRYLIWYQVYIVVLLNRYALDLDINKNIEFYDDEKSWLLKTEWPHTLGELCDLTNRIILSHDALTLTTLLDLVIEVVFSRDTIKSDKNLWHKWWQRIRDKINKAINDSKIDQGDIPNLLAILRVTPSNANSEYNTTTENTE